jgi:transposase InsO family protein/transposase-like protein
MPWKEQSKMDERLRFVARRLEGESMTDLCREFGISRKTGYKIFNRYKEEGADRPGGPVPSARAVRQPAARPDRAGDHRGKEGQAQLGCPQDPGTAGTSPGRDVRIPAHSTIHAVLDRHGLVKKAGRRRQRALGTALSAGSVPNALWCVDFKGEFRLGNQAYCYPLTVTDHASRFILACEALEGTKEAPVIEAFHTLFRARGLPDAIRSDNGVPFASPNGLYNLSKLSVWWLRLGIAIERIKPGHPQQNGRHERMHLTLKQETTRPASANPLQQQVRFDDFVSEYNTERPHEGLDMATPAEVYTPSARIYEGLPEIDYPFHDREVLITACGRICMHRKKINISTVLAGQRVGIKEVDDGIWLVTFMHYDLGYIDLEQRTLQTINNPFGANV